MEPNHVKAVQCYKRATQLERGMDGKIKAMLALGCMYSMSAQKEDHAWFHKSVRILSFRSKRDVSEGSRKGCWVCETGSVVERSKEERCAIFGLSANSGRRKSQLKPCSYYKKAQNCSR